MEYSQPRRMDEPASSPPVPRMIALGDFSGSVKQAIFVAPVLKHAGNDLGAEAVQNALNSDGVWAAQVIPRLGNVVKSWWGFDTYPEATLQVTMKRKNGIGFDPDVAQSLVTSAAASVRTILASFSEWAVQIVDDASGAVQALSPTEVAATTNRYWSKKVEEIKTIGFGPAFGIPGWVLPTVGVGAVGIAGILLLAKTAEIKKAFFGDAPRRKRKKRKKSKQAELLG